MKDDFTTYKYYLSAHKTIVSQDVCYFIINEQEA